MPILLSQQRDIKALLSVSSAVYHHRMAIKYLTTSRALSVIFAAFLLDIITL